MTMTEKVWIGGSKGYPRAYTAREVVGRRLDGVYYVAEESDLPIYVPETLVTVKDTRIAELEAEVLRLRAALECFPDMCNGEAWALRLAADTWWCEHGKKALNGDSHDA